MCLDPVSDHVGALARSRWGVHPEAADAAAIYRGVCGVGRGEGQVLEYRGIKHPQPVQPAHWSALVVADSVHRSAHPLPP